MSDLRDDQLFTPSCGEGVGGIGMRLWEVNGCNQRVKSAHAMGSPLHQAW